MRTGELKYPSKKSEMLRRIKEYAAESPVIAVSKIRKVRASQMMMLRKDFRGEVNIIVGKNKLTKMALKSGRKNIDAFLKTITDQNALIFTGMNPFKLQLLLDKHKVDLPARAGDIATDDVVLPAGNTGMPPGPVLSEFKELKVPTRIDAGNIVITRDTPVLKAGDTITPRLAGLLSRLGLKPIKAGLSLDSAYLDGVVFRGHDLRLDLDEYRRNIHDAYNSVMTLAVNSAYPTKETTPLIIGRAELDARALALASAYPAAEVLPGLLASGEQQAETLLNLAKPKGYS